MLSKFDPDGSRTLSLDEYIRACLFLQTVARAFGAFDPQVLCCCCVVLCARMCVVC
jgi:hypothetical protein